MKAAPPSRPQKMYHDATHVSVVGSCQFSPLWTLAFPVARYAMWTVPLRFSVHRPHLAPAHQRPPSPALASRIRVGEINSARFIADRLSQKQDGEVASPEPSRLSELLVNQCHDGHHPNLDPNDYATPTNVAWMQNSYTPLVPLA